MGNARNSTWYKEKEDLMKLLRAYGAKTGVELKASSVKEEKK